MDELTKLRAENERLRSDNHALDEYVYSLTINEGEDDSLTVLKHHVANLIVERDAAKAEAEKWKAELKQERDQSASRGDHS